MGNLYTKMKIFHFKDKLDSLASSRDKIMPPVHIRLKPTNMCNHNCSYCAYRADNLQLGKDMRIKDRIPREKMMEIIGDIIEMGVKSLTFSGGGEPFCYPHLLDVVRKLIPSPVKFAALTNGALLQGELAEAFAHNASWLRISMDGWDDESYSSYRQVPLGEFSKILGNIERFKKYRGKCYLGVCIIVNQKNAAHLYGLLERLKHNGVSSIKVAPCIVSNSGRENNNYHKPVFNQVKDQIERAFGELVEEGFEIFDSYHGQLESFEKKYNWCPYLQILPVIGADLNIYPCQDKAYNLDEGLIGSIKDCSFREFWFSDKNKFFKVNPSLHCGHHCVADAKNRLVLDYLSADEGHLGFV